jgi:hypothetical protein
VAVFLGHIPVERPDFAKGPTAENILILHPSRRIWR